MCEQKLSVFSADYWRAARRELNNPRVLAFSGLVCAMAIVLESLPIDLLGPSLKNDKNGIKSPGNHTDAEQDITEIKVQVDNR